jgi:D-alanyl-lipoteichoic acid acyltransferase DltB (MBOAT superfamily)
LRIGQGPRSILPGADAASPGDEMLFNSTEYLIFGPLVLALYYVLSRPAQNAMLLVASYVFYAWFDWRFLGLLLVSSFVDYFVALAIEGAGSRARRRALLTLSVVVNLGILGTFKYLGFFVESLSRVAQGLGFSVSGPAIEVLLPIGISFYTFQSLAYTIDVYRGRRSATRDPVLHGLYVAFFPQLVAGPIERAGNLVPQLERVRRVSGADLGRGLQLLVFGYLKKVGIADALAPRVDTVFADPAAHGSPELLLAVYLFAIQIYCDFSGYTDIARGSARLLGIRLRSNFRQPYLSADITEFWRRWHMSLSSWLRDYLYIPLGGSRRGRLRTAANLLATMLLGGLWHGAAWNFVVWGALHGLFLIGHRLIGRGRRALGAARVLATLATFHLVCFAWIFFRAPDLATALEYLRLIAAMEGTAASSTLLLAAAAGAAVAGIDLACARHAGEVPLGRGAPAWRRGLTYAAAIAWLSFVGETGVQPFIYFQF